MKRLVLCTALLLSATPAAAQELRLSNLADSAGRPIEDLVQALPGTPIPLERLVAEAKARNLTLETSRVLRRLGEAGVEVEGGLFDPSLTVSALVDDGLAGRSSLYRARLGQYLPWGTFLGVDVTRRGGVSVAAGAGSDTDVDLTLSQPLLEGLGTLGTDLEVARLRRRASTLRLVRAGEELVTAVRLAYWDLAEAEAVEAVLQRSLEIAEALLFRNEELARRDLASELDVVTARSGVELRRAGLIEARRNRRDAAERLVFLVWGEAAPDRLGTDTLPVKTATPPPPAPDPGPLARVLEVSLDARADVRAARADVQAAEAVAHRATRARLPSLTLDGSLSSGLGPTLSTPGAGESWGWSLGLSLSQPLLNRTDRGASEVADLTAELRRLDLVILANDVRLEVREAARDIRAQTRRSAAADEAARLARLQLAAERRRLELGLGDSFRLLLTEENAAQAELASVRARYALARAADRYALATGTVADAS